MPAVPDNLLARLVSEALREDLGPGDLTCEALVDPGRRARAIIVTRQEIVAAGVEAARRCFAQLDPSVEFLEVTPPGTRLAAGETLLVVEGEARALLSAERTALNFLGRLSGISTLTRRCVDAVEGTGTRILDTRKTNPGQRLLEREAVSLGGGTNHRFGLFDAVLIKENHLAMSGGPADAVRRARARLGDACTIEVEIETLDQLAGVIEAGPDIVLLDNMSRGEVAEAVAVAGKVPGRRPLLEASGGITLDNIRSFAETGVDRISLGALTHSAPAADLSLRLTALS